MVIATSARSIRINVCESSSNNDLIPLKRPSSNCHLASRGGLVRRLITVCNELEWLACARKPSLAKGVRYAR